MMINRRQKLRRQGSLYIAVLGVTTIVGIIAMVSVTVGRLQIRQVVSQADRHDAQLLARAGVEFAYNCIEQTNNWRNTMTSGVESAPVSMGRGTFTYSATDVDGNLNDGDDHAFTLRGIGRVGNVLAVEEVEVEPQGVGLTCLEAAVHTDKHLELKTHRLTTNQTVSSNGEIRNDDPSAFIAGDAWSGDYVLDHGNLSGTATENQSPLREMPSLNVFDYYLANGTLIDIASIPEDSGERMLGYTLLSPARNPFGEPNAQGIYVIDCEGQAIKLLRLRVVGTLVLLDVHPHSRVDSVVNMAPAVTNYPTLLVQGDFSFDMAGTFGVQSLVESSASTNFNPADTPYGGQSDEDQYDSYPSQIEGLVYVSGKIDITDNSNFNGCVVADDLHLEDDAVMNYLSRFLNNPPPGFRQSSGPLRILPGSWRRAAL